MTIRITIFSLLLAGVLTGPGCAKEKRPSPEIIARYEQDADRLCRAIVGCIKADISARLAGHPERRDLILKRMSRDLCIKGQYRLIGQLSVTPMPDRNRPRPGPELYRLYAECSRAVARESNCSRRKEIHKNHPACKQIRREPLPG